MIYTKVKNVPNNQRPYILWEPNDQPITRVIIDMHGLGERGSNIDKLFNTGMCKALKNNPDYNINRTAVICPQIPSGRSWNQETKNAYNIAEYLFEGLPIIASGLSNGGEGSLLFRYRHPEQTIGFINMSGYATVTDEKLQCWASVPSYTTFGALPHNNNKIVLTKVIPYLNDHGTSGTQTHVYDDLAHNTWDRAFNFNHPNNVFKWIDSIGNPEVPIYPPLEIEPSEYEKGFQAGGKDMRQRCLDAINDL